MKKKEKEEYKIKAVDSAISNLSRTDDEQLDGDFINSYNCGSFSSINTPVCGIETDVDEL